MKVANNSPAPKDLGSVTATFGGASPFVGYKDPLEIPAFPLQKATVALMSIPLGFFSAVYTVEKAQNLLLNLGFSRSEIADIMLGLLSITGNTSCNTQQIYESFFQLRKILYHIYLQHRHPDKVQAKNKLSSCKTFTSFVCAISGAFLVTFVAWPGLQNEYPNIRGWLAFTTTVAAFAENLLGASPLAYVIGKQMCMVFNFCTAKQAFFPISQNEADIAVALEMREPQQLGYGAMNQAKDSVFNQELVDVFYKLRLFLQKLDAQQKNTLTIFRSKLYFEAGTTFKKNPGLLLSVMLLGKIDLWHPALNEAHQTEILNALEEKDTNKLLVELRKEVFKIELLPMNCALRAKFISIIAFVIFMCLSYIWDIAMYFADRVNSPLGSLFGLLGLPGAIMMFALAINTFNILLKNQKNIDSSNVSWATICVGIFLGLAAALLEASLGAAMLNFPGGNWIGAILGLLTKGLVVNPLFAYRFAESATYTVSSSVAYLKSCRSTPTEAKSSEEAVNELIQYVAKLERNAGHLPYTDLDDFANATRGLQRQDGSMADHVVIEVVAKHKIVQNKEYIALNMEDQGDILGPDGLLLGPRNSRSGSELNVTN